MEMKRTVIPYLLTAAFLPAYSLLMAMSPTQEGGVNGAGATPALNWVYNNLVVLLGAAIIVGAFLALYSATNMLLQAQKMRIMQEHGVEVPEEVSEQQPQESWWAQQYRKWTDVVPVEKEKDIILEHPHDGIYELDNSLPPWWVALFYITIAFSVVYVGYYHVFDKGLLQMDEYKQEVEVAEKEVKAYLAKQADFVDETNVTTLVEANELALGETIYKTNCASCHGALGEGGVGPNMTDNYWLHGGSIQDVFKTIKYGVPEKGMISWKEQIRPGDMQRVASYLLTLVGTNPPNAKEPQGELFTAAADGKDDAAADGNDVNE